MRRSLAVPALLAVVSTSAIAQPPGATISGFEIGHNYIGPSIGLGGLGSASLAIGGRFERGFKALPEFGNGILGIGAEIDYYSYNDRFTGTDYGFTYIPIGVTANYHFVLKDNKKIDPFVGLGLGYSIARFDSGFDDSIGDVSGSTIYFIGKAGARYFFRDRLAIQGDVGAGAAALNLGLIFKM